MRIEHECEGGPGTNIVGQNQRAGRRQLVKTAVERDHKLIRHQQSLVCPRWKQNPNGNVAVAAVRFQCFLRRKGLSMIFLLRR